MTFNNNSNDSNNNLGKELWVLVGQFHLSVERIIFQITCRKNKNGKAIKFAIVSRRKRHNLLNIEYLVQDYLQCLKKVLFSGE